MIDTESTLERPQTEYLELANGGGILLRDPTEDSAPPPYPPSLSEWSKKPLQLIAG